MPPCIGCSTGIRSPGDSLDCAAAESCATEPPEAACRLSIPCAVACSGLGPGSWPCGPNALGMTLVSLERARDASSMQWRRTEASGSAAETQDMCLQATIRSLPYRRNGNESHQGGHSHRVDDRPGLGAANKDLRSDRVLAAVSMTTAAHAAAGQYTECIRSRLPARAAPRSPARAEYRFRPACAADGVPARRPSAAAPGGVLRAGCATLSDVSG